MTTMNKNKTQLNCHWLRWISYYQNAKQIHHQSLQALISMRNCEHPEKLSRNPPKKCQTSSSKNNWEKTPKFLQGLCPFGPPWFCTPGRVAWLPLACGGAQLSQSGKGGGRGCVDTGSGGGRFGHRHWAWDLINDGIMGDLHFFFSVFSPWIWALKDVSRHFFHAMNGVNLQVGWLGDRSLLTQLLPL